MSVPKPPEHFLYADRDLQFAIPIADVLEIIDLARLLPPHEGIPGCVGQVLHRDFLVPVIDSATLGTRRTDRPPAPSTAIIVQHAEVLFGLTIERHVAVVPLGERSARSARIPGPAGGSELDGAVNPFVEARRAYRDNLLIVLSVPAIAARVEQTIGDQRVVAGEDDGASAEPAQEDLTEPEDFLLARIESINLAIPLDAVVEVVEGNDVTPLFAVHPMLRGLINLRGQVLACLDISPEMGLTSRVLEERNQFVVMSGGGIELALAVDHILGIRALRLDRLQGADAVLSGEVTRYFHGVLETAEGPLLFLSVPTLLDSPHLQPYRSHDG